MKNEFNPKEWLTNPVKDSEAIVSNKTAIPTITSNKNNIEDYIALIEQFGIDITNNYTNWLNIGFAIADEYGDTGREYFCRISKNHPNFNQIECNEQYTNA